MKKINNASSIALITLVSSLGISPAFASDQESVNNLTDQNNPPSSAHTATSDQHNEETIIITGQRLERKSRGATGLDLNLFETPQSLTILEAETIADFGLTDINSMLSMATGINVDSTETDRTYYNSRGFDITRMHVDSVGIPFGTLQVGDLDTAIYEKVEIIRGSNGLITGLGNPSGTVNYVRKRPVNDFEMTSKFSYGSWDNKRLVADVSTPLTESSSWATRIIGVYQEGESWLDHYRNDRNVISIITDGQLGDQVTAAVGYTRQDNNSSGVLWGAMPIIYSDGQQADFDVSTSTTMDWTFWDTLTETAFAEIAWQISDNWQLTSTLTKTDYEENSELFYVYWLTGLDPATGLGMYSYPGKYDGLKETLIWDNTLQGSFKAWGQTHQFNLGMSFARSDSSSLDFAALDGFIAMPAFPGWAGNEVARPTWAAPYRAAFDDTQLNRVYGSTLFSLTDNFQLLLGASLVDYENDGESWGVSTDSSEDGNSPYLGFTWALTGDLNLYASYSDIYQPQFYLNEQLQPLGSAQGKSYEAGLKKQLSQNSLVSVALFKTEQQNLQEFVEYGDGDGVDDTDFSDDFDFAIYRGINVESKGVELEVAGKLTDNLSLQAGYTYLEMKDPEGNEARSFIPRNTFKLLAVLEPEWQEDLTMGLSIRWQDDIYFDSAYGQISQDDYALVGGFFEYALDQSMSLSLNLENLLDEKYLSSVKYEQSYYAAPRNFTLSFNWTY